MSLHFSIIVARADKMDEFKLYSDRLYEAEGKFSDVYSYDKISQKLMNQMTLELQEFFHDLAYENNLMFYQILNEVISLLKRGHGTYYFDNNSTVGNWIYGSRSVDKDLLILNYLNSGIIVAKILDVIDLLIDRIKINNIDRGKKIDGVIERLNYRFRSNGFGYLIENYKIIRIDSLLTHAEIIKPVLYLLSNNPLYKSANREMLQAFDHYKNGNYKAAITEACNSVESVLKVICHQKKWEIKKDDTYKYLLDACKKGGLFNEYMDNHETALKNLLENAQNTIRNKAASHGAGMKEIFVSENLCAYALHLAASNLAFLIKQANFQG